MAFITFNWTKNFLYVISYWVLEIIFRILYSSQSEYFSLTENPAQKEYINVILLNIGDLLSGFLVLYTKYSSSNKIEIKKDEDTKSGKGGLIYTNIINITKKNFKIKSLIIGILEYISGSLYWIAYAITAEGENTIMFSLQKDMVCSLDVFMRYILSIFVLKMVMFRHVILSIIIISIGFAILLITDFIYLFDKNYSSLVPTLFYSAILLLRGISLPFEHTLVKQILKENYILPQSLQFFRGIIVFLIILIMTPIFYFALNVDLKINYEGLKILALVFYTLRGFVRAFITLKIIYHYSAQSVSFLIISESLGSVLYSIYDIIKKKESNYFLIYVFFEIIGILIIIFAAFIYDEIIIINKWKLDENVKLGIINRGENELLELHDLDEASIRITETFTKKDKIFTEDKNKIKDDDESNDIHINDVDNDIDDDNYE